MLNKFIRRFFGSGHPPDPNLTRMRSEIDDLRTRVQILTLENLSLKEKVKNRVITVDTAAADPDPSDSAAREAYVTEVTAFYDFVGRKKLQHLIALVREELDSVYAAIPAGYTRQQYDEYLRGTSNGFKLLIDWFELLKGEHLSKVSPNE